MIDLAFVMACIPPDVSPYTVQRIVQVESAGDPYVLHINDMGSGRAVRSPSVASAQATLQRLLSSGYSVDIGLMQVNWRGSGGHPEELLDPCRNLYVGASLLREKYLAALDVAPAGQSALQAALSAYNTGSFTRGFANGYVSQYYGWSVQPTAGEINPRGQSSVRRSGTGTVGRTDENSPYTASMDVYQHEGAGQIGSRSVKEDDHGKYRQQI